MSRMANVPFELKGRSVYVAGHRGMVGSAIVRRLAREEVKLVTADRGEVDLLIGDSSKARDVLGWKPKRSFGQLVEEMMTSDLAEAKRDVANGKRTV